MESSNWFNRNKNKHNENMPQGFDLSGAWEIKERVIISNTDSVPLSRPEPDNLTVFGYSKETPRYLVENQPNVGKGNVSKVYRGWDRKLGKEVAVKTLQHVPYNDTQVELEAKTMAKLNHPGIPEIYDFTIADKGGYQFPVLIMELIKGKTLLERMVAKNLSISEVILVTTQVASTMDYMQKFNLYHRDVKPNNIVLSAHHTKLIDFGSSNWADPTGTKNPFSAPEALYEQHFDIKADIYSLAANGYAILCDVIPEPENRGDIEIKNPIYKLGNKNIQMLNKVFKKALAIDKDERPRTAMSFALEFALALEGVN